jgi:hypothetical protein
MTRRFLAAPLAMLGVFAGSLVAPLAMLALFAGSLAAPLAMLSMFAGTLVAQDRPDSAGRGAARRAAREALFADTTPLVLALRFDHRAVFRDRDTLSRRRYDGRVIVRTGTGADTVPVRVRPRGHFRLGANNCDFVPLRLEFRDRPSRGTLFDGQEALKLVTHCKTDVRDYDEYLLREHLVYRMHNLLTPLSFRSRLVEASYSDSLDGGWRVSRRALLIEDEASVSRRAGGKVAEQRGAVWDNLDSTAVAQYALFQYFIGGTDWSLSALHNVRVVQRPDGVYIPLAYDFDWTGMAQTPYAIPDPRLRVSRTRDRLFRGPCWSVDAFAGAVAGFTAQRAALLALLDTPGLSEEYRSSTRRWIEEFYTTVSDQKAFEKAIKRGCAVGT